MKNELFLLLALVMLCLPSCQNDPCDLVECQNEGVCESGTCDCLLGYGGDLCEIFIREQVIGGFEITSDCLDGSSATDNWSVFASSSSLDAILINNFHATGLDVNATVTASNTIEIAEQPASNSLGIYTVSGSGIIEEDGVFTMEYTITNEGLSESTSCSINATRK